MKSICSFLLAVIVSTASMTSSAVAEDKFANLTIDLGVVVSDLEASVKFYTEAVGFTEVKGFSVPADYAKKVGLSDGKELNVRVLVLGEGDGATKLKLMEFPKTESKKTDNTHIHSQIGFSYITIFVKSTEEAVARAKKAGVETVAESPLLLPKPFPEGVGLTLVRDPDGNIVEFVGPMGKK